MSAVQGFQEIGGLVGREPSPYSRASLVSEMSETYLKDFEPAVRGGKGSQAGVEDPGASAWVEGRTDGVRMLCYTSARYVADDLQTSCAAHRRHATPGLRRPDGSAIPRVGSHGMFFHAAGSLHRDPAKAQGAKPLTAATRYPLVAVLAGTVSWP